MHDLGNGRADALNASHCRSGNHLAHRRQVAQLLFAVAALAAELERELVRERTINGLRTAAAAGQHGGRPAHHHHRPTRHRPRPARGESVTDIAEHLGSDTGPPSTDP